MPRKTILMTISRGATARNIFQSDVYRQFKEAGVRLVVLTPAYRDERFLREFQAENVVFENLVEPRWSWLDTMLVGAAKALVYNSSTRLRDRYGIPGSSEPRGNLLKYLVKMIVCWPLSRLRILRELVRALDRLLVKDRYYAELFDRYKPDLVFATSVIEDSDVFVLKQARARGIKTIGMPRSWDNLSKISVRVKPDKLIVWGEFSRDEALRFQNCAARDIIMCGIPQFDFYRRPEFTVSRDDFCRAYGIDPARKIVVFCSEGKYTPFDGEVADIIARSINEGKTARPCALLIRPHFLFLGDEKKFDVLRGTPNVVVDAAYEHAMVFRDHWDYSMGQIKQFTNIMRHADVVITSVSSISLDASAFDKPIINVKFDGYRTLPFRESVARIYLYEHYLKVLSSGAVKVVNSAAELFAALNQYLTDPSLRAEKRKNLRNYFCGPADGKAGRRIAEAVLGYLNDEV